MHGCGITVARIVAGGSFLLATIVYAEVKLPSVFSDHMVLQRETAAPVWGWAKAGEAVTVKIAGQTKEAVADAGGKWMVRLDPLPAGGPHEMVVSGAITLTIKDILVGDVWVCSGQSNMNIHFGHRGQPIENREQEVAAANFPQIRHFGESGGQQWLVCSPETAPKFTAVGYAFGRELHQDLKVPIGLLHASTPGSTLSGWVRKEILLEHFPATASRVEAFSGKAGKELRAFTQAEVMFGPVIYYEQKIALLIPFGTKGAIWYQGESGAGLDLPYGKLFQLMIRDWRKQWGEGDFPFYFVQVGHWDVCEGQASALQLPNTGMAVINDLSDTVHPPKKVPIGQRLARLALVQTYGRKGESSGPIVESAKVEGSAIRVRFKHAADGLVIREGPPMKYFTIAGDDRKFLAADVRIDSDTVVVSHPKIPRPVAVRYAWTGSSYLNPKEAILLSKAALPAAPFRTDDWPIEEKPRKGAANPLPSSRPAASSSRSHS